MQPGDAGQYQMHDGGFLGAKFLPATGPQQEEVAPRVEVAVPNAVQPTRPAAEHELAAHVWHGFPFFCREDVGSQRGCRVGFSHLRADGLSKRPVGFRIQPPSHDESALLIVNSEINLRDWNNSTGVGPAAPPRPESAIGLHHVGKREQNGAAPLCQRRVAIGDFHNGGEQSPGNLSRYSMFRR